jgi:acyl-CoA synthetase (AMP-forming)/AMP-acid ligase II
MNIVANSVQINTPYLSPTRPSFGDHQDVLPCVLPFFHIYGLTVTLLGKMAHGVKIVTLPRFNPETFLNAQAKYQGSVLFLVPPIRKNFFKYFESN